MLKKLLLISSLCIIEGYSAGPAAQSSAAPAQSAPARSYPNLAVSNYDDIFAAARSGDMNAVQKFVNNGGYSTDRKTDGTTVLHFAAYSGSPDIQFYIMQQEVGI